MLGAAQYNGRPSPTCSRRGSTTPPSCRTQGIAPMIVVTGGKQPGDEFTEAGVGRRLPARSSASPTTAILRETTSRNSWESLAASARFLQDRGIRDVVLVSDPFHSLRIELIAEELGFDAVHVTDARRARSTALDEWLRFRRRGGAGRGRRGVRLRSARRALRSVGECGNVGPGLAILAGPSGVV